VLLIIATPFEACESPLQEPSPKRCAVTVGNRGIGGNQTQHHVTLAAHAARLPHMVHTSGALLGK
jgi:hypothetical protein